MTNNTEPSVFEFLWKGIASVLAPMAEASRLLQQLNVRSLEDTCDALTGAGYAIVRADLPPGVRGFAQMIGCQPYIVTNRCDSCEEHRYTVAHELGHYTLHVSPSPAIAKLGLADASKADQESHANQFATAWFVRTASPEQRKRFLQKNPEVNSILTDSMMAVLLTVGTLIALYLLSRVFSKSA